MENVIDLTEYQDRISGNAICLQCKHQWVVVAPIGTVELECPVCRTFKGVFEGMTSPENVWECKCGNQHFYVYEEGAMCAKCGITQVFD